MFIYNFKMDGNKIGKIFLGILFALIIVITLIVTWKVLGINFFRTNDTINQKEIYEITDTNYTNVLKTVHDDLDKYIGQKISYSGYIYRMYDFTEAQFVLARNMVISSDFQTVVVGFLCECENGMNYSNNSWVKIEGTITKGDYHGEIPIIKITKIESIDKPLEEYVYPPDDSFVSTSTVL